MEFGKEYIKDFENNIEYSEFIVSSGYIEPNVSHIELGNMIHYNKDEHDYSKNYLTFIPLEEGNFTLTIGSAVTTTMLQSVSYSIDGGQTWTTTNNANDTTITITTPTVNTDDTVMWKGIGTTCFKGNENGGFSGGDEIKSFFTSSGKYDVFGNIMSFLYGDNFENVTSFAEGSTCNFAMLFGVYSHNFEYKIVHAHNLILPATTLTPGCYQYMFSTCRLLESVPKLSAATTVLRRSYRGIFLECSSLKKAPDLPATNVGMYSYTRMFSGCTSLTSAPELPATTLGNYCYQNMFYDCKSLTTPPTQLPATTLATYCYASMFSNCTSLTAAPQLHATTLATYCCDNMFYNCINLRIVPPLPDAPLEQDCYRGMFRDCTSLTDAPELTASTLAVSSYTHMFSGCTSLTAITCLATDISATGCLDNWTSNVSPSGVFIKAASMSDWTTGVNGIPSGWVVKTDQDDKYLTFVATQSGTFKFNGDSMDYSLDGGNTWTSLASNTDSPTVSAGNKIMWKATLTPRWGGRGKFSSTGNFTVEGNPMSLLFGDNFIGQTSLSGKNYAFYGLFNSCTGMTSAENLSLHATTLATYCYDQMFIGCTNLTTAPQLPATTLVNFCYEYMFYGCTSLTTAPQLPATTLADYCYNSMFEGCTSLTKAPQLPATTLVNFCYEYMFYGCTSLTTAPQLPATTLANNCYYGMFRDCTSLNSITCLAPDISASSCTYNWVDGVAASGTFTKAASMSNWTTGIDGIPSGWSVVNAS